MPLNPTLPEMMVLIKSTTIPNRPDTPIFTIINVIETTIIIGEVTMKDPY